MFLQHFVRCNETSHANYKKKKNMLSQHVYVEVTNPMHAQAFSFAMKQSKFTQVPHTQFRRVTASNLTCIGDSNTWLSHATSLILNKQCACEVVH